MICLSFGRAKDGFSLKDEEEFREYTSAHDGEVYKFSQNNDGQSPFENKIGRVMTEGTWN